MWHKLLFTISILTLLLAGPALPARGETSIASYYKIISAYDFSPNNSTIKFQGFGSEIYATQLDPGSAFSAQVNLPQGAQIWSVDYYLIDNTDHTSDIECGMRIYTPSSDTASTVAWASTSSLSPSASVQTVTSASGLPVTVDNSLKSYFLRVELTTTGTDQAIVGARVTYTLPDPAPTGSRYLTAGGWAFRPMTSAMEYTELGNQVRITTNAYSYHMIDHLNLPVGAQITALAFYVIDNDSTNNLTVGLDRTQINNSAMNVTNATTSGAQANLKALSVPGVAQTVQAGYSYSLYFRIAEGSSVSSNLLIAGARITYTLPTTLTPAYYTASISGMNFRPSASLIGYSAFGGGQYQSTPLPSFGLFGALDLPQGANLHRITCYVKDNDSANSVECSLKAFQPSANTSLLLAEASTSGMASSTNTLTISDQMASGVTANPVNNGLYQYMVRVYYGGATNSNLMTFGVLVDYSWPIYLPIVRR